MRRIIFTICVIIAMQKPITSMRWLVVHVFRVAFFLEKEERISRGEYRIWISVLFFIVWILRNFIAVDWITTTLHILQVIIFIIPFCSLSIKRAHDLNMSGWWCLSLFVPWLNLYMLVRFLFFVGNNNHNSFGVDPMKHIPLHNKTYWFASLLLYGSITFLYILLFTLFRVTDFHGFRSFIYSQ